MPTRCHEKLLKNNITEAYRKAPPKLVNTISLEAKHTATNMKLADRIEHSAKSLHFTF